MRQIRLNAFNMSTVGHIAHGLWRHPRDDSMQYRSLGYWTDLARLLEQGLFDALFLADVIGVNDVYGGSHDAACERAVQLPINDPMLPITAMAAVTRHLGFGVTANLSFESPYLLARRFSTLDHLTDGRIGWNIVTGYLDSAARALGHDGQVAHDRRYELAEDYMACVYKLWEGSWEDGAVLGDRDAGVYANPAKVHAIDHAGPFVAMRGVHLCEPSPQRTPVLFQAGSSPRGRAFAGKHAECVFISGRERADAKFLVSQLRAEAVAAGRAACSILVFMGVIVIVGRTRAEAQAKYLDYKAYADPRGGLVHICSSMGIDLSGKELDEALVLQKTQSMVSVVEAITTRSAAPKLTVRALLAQMELGSRTQTIVGTAAEIADELIGWMDEADLDGFNLIRTVSPECFADVIDQVIPELQRRGAYKTAYVEGTFRAKLRGGAAPHLPAEHVARQYAHAAADMPRP